MKPPRVSEVRDRLDRPPPRRNYFCLASPCLPFMYTAHTRDTVGKRRFRQRCSMISKDRGPGRWPEIGRLSSRDGDRRRKPSDAIERVGEKKELRLWVSEAVK
ncbi:hypothetical protein KFK09_027726 [Dendrobium nobile]|uniref:Uncharacterized protein n=1 Tax=Dendrobium nobile TaxID=94219 RepID=A0A8T3A5D3_DENNO|nr:hypothetical protein KFK09_027726 [Dendrobium nobile]